ncbi:ABC transporter ATP-binding protein [Haploplasma modicum]|uniref:ABC transporter ATP-binding protein n=1 Tax=Haploplasma modicum TaxID=2150 RepID=UPI00214CDF5D|nr:ABC transporter ATP-binding protein [Haploplasma modicum]MCR1809172.1 ABC transporter ATP-binding protein/permease [Haploplasma modicum]
MLKMFKHLGIKEVISIILSIGLIVLQVWLDLKLPEYMKEIMTLIQTPGSATKDILVVGGNMLLLAFASLSAAVVTGFFMARVAAAFSRRVRGKMFDKITSFSNEEINNFETASLITRTTNDVSQIQMFITMGVQLLIKAPIMAVWSIIKIYNVGVEWSTATFVTLILLSILIAIIMIFVIPKIRKVQSLTDDVTKSVRENLKGVRVIRAYNAEGFQENKFDVKNNNLTEVVLFTNKAMSFMMPIMNFLMSVLMIAIYYIGAILLKNQIGDPLLQVDTFANMLIFSQYAMMVIMAFIMLVMIFFLLPRSLVSAKRINEVLYTKPKIVDGNIDLEDTKLKGTIEFKNVSFKYPEAEEYVLKDINLEINKGETVAFIGSTGSGKSTLINLIPRFYDASSGQVLINGIDVRDYKLFDLNEKIGYVAQKAVLFKGKVSDNIAFGTNKERINDETDIWEALEIAQAKDFVSELEDKLDSDIAQSGTNLSGGQKQRLSIARAVAKKPEIFIFDDSFSALDFKTDRALRTALKEKTKGTTNLVVAQRIGTIMEADKIVVLDEGFIVGVGKHKDLLKSCKVYLEIALSQLTEEELQ